MSEAVNTGSWIDKIKIPFAGNFSGGDMRAWPFLRRFAGLKGIRGLSPVKQNVLVQSALVPFDVAGRLREGENPIRAVTKPIWQLGGGVGGGLLGGALGFPTTGPGGFATTALGATGGYHGAGALYEKVFPKGDSNLKKDVLRLAAVSNPIGWGFIPFLNKSSNSASNFTASNSASNFIGGPLPKTSPSQGPQISNIGETPPEFQVGGKYGPSEEALIDLADQETLYNQKGEYIGGVLPEGDGIDHRATWLHKTRNSPAAKAGHSEDARWGTYLGNQAWRKDHGRSYDTSIDHLLKPSSENKRVWNVFGNEVVMDDNKIPVSQKVDDFLDNVPAEVIEANIAKNEADKAKVNSGEMTAAEYFGTNIR